MADVAKVIRVGDTLTNLIDPVTKQLVEYHKTMLWYDGSPMTDLKLDPHGIYVRKGAEYFVKSLGKYGQVLQKDTMQEMRDISDLEVLLLNMGYYSHVQLNGYYEKGDTDNPIDYYIDEIDTSPQDNGGSIIELSTAILKHTFIKDIDIKYFGAIGDNNTDNVSYITNCLNEANVLGLNVIIPSGQYVTSSIVVNIDNISIYGQGSIIGDSVGGGNDVLNITGNKVSIKDITVIARGRARVIILLNGDNNKISGCEVYCTVPVTSSVTQYQWHCVRLDGNYNIIENSELYNQGAGVNSRFTNNIIRNNCIHDNQQGVYLSASSRDVLIDGNKIINNNATHDDGCDGIYGQRNVSRITITNNTIVASGEHGIYFQGDNSIIKGNIIRDCQGGGIKLASYDTGLYWYDEETPEIDYIGHSNIISDNICNNNGTLVGSTNGGIYLQNPLRNITVFNNNCQYNPYGIRTATTFPEKPLVDIKISGNTSLNNVNNDIQAEVSDGLVISFNTINNAQFHSGNWRMVKPIYENNLIYGLLTLSNNDEAIIRNNFFNTRPSINDNCVDIEFTGNTIKNSTSINLRRYKIFDNNIINISGQFTVTLGVLNLISFCNNVITFTGTFGANDYLIFPNNVSTNPCTMSNNVFNLTSDNILARVIRWYGDSLIFQANRTNGSSLRAFDIYSSNGVISNNIGNIAFQTGSIDNIVFGNKSILGGSTGFQKLDTIAASANTANTASGSTPTKAEFDALLTELRDLKTKMRTVKLLNT